MNTNEIAAIPIISIKIKHGQTFGTVGHVPALSPGDISAKVELKGKTKDASGEEIDLVHSLNFSSKALYVDLSLTTDSIERDLTKPTIKKYHFTCKSILKLHKCLLKSNQ